MNGVSAYIVAIWALFAVFALGYHFPAFGLALAIVVVIGGGVWALTECISKAIASAEEDQ